MKLRTKKLAPIDVVEQLLAEGRIRQYIYRQLITHLARKYGHRLRALYVRYLFAAAIAIGYWPSEDALECRFAPLESKASAEISSNRDLVFGIFFHEFLNATKGVPIQAAFRYDRGNWRIAMNYKSR
jgi:hypothetical protein